MSDNTNEYPTAKLEDFGLASEADSPQPTASTLPLGDGGKPAAASTETAAPAGGTQLAEAEPAWLSQWGKRPERTTPRIRWAGVIWGLVFIAAGWYALWTLNEPARRSAFSDWIVTLGNGGWAIVAAFALGGLLLVLGLIAALRATTRPRA